MRRRSFPVTGSRYLLGFFGSCSSPLSFAICPISDYYRADLSWGPRDLDRCEGAPSRSPGRGIYWVSLDLVAVLCPSPFVRARIIIGQTCRGVHVTWIDAKALLPGHRVEVFIGFLWIL